jgi:hypothetical protein
MSRIEPMAMKMSSPKNRLIVRAAVCARTLSRNRGGSGPSFASAAASAIGAISGRTICGCPPSAVRPSAAVTWRTNR